MAAANIFFTISATAVSKRYPESSASTRGAGRLLRWQPILRGTGYPDLFVANDYGVSELYLNENGKRFREVGKESGVGYAPKSGMTASVGDILNQGRYGIFVTNISEEGVLVQGNNLWMPQPGTSGDDLKFENVANAMGVELGGWSFGAQFGDLNNDGLLDLYQVNGNISLDPDHSYWYDYSKVAGGNAPSSPMRPTGRRSRAEAYLAISKNASGSMTEPGNSKRSRNMVGVTDRFDGRPVALADFGNNGALDAVIANQRRPRAAVQEQG